MSATLQSLIQMFWVLLYVFTDPKINDKEPISSTGMQLLSCRSKQVNVVTVLFCFSRVLGNCRSHKEFNTASAKALDELSGVAVLSQRACYKTRNGNGNGTKRNEIKTVLFSFFLYIARELIDCDEFSSWL